MRSDARKRLAAQNYPDPAARELLAEVWDLGYDAGRREAADRATKVHPVATVNPYRASS